MTSIQKIRIVVYYLGERADRRRRPRSSALVNHVTLIQPHSIHGRDLRSRTEAAHVMVSLEPALRIMLALHAPKRLLIDGDAEQEVPVRLHRVLLLIVVVVVVILSVHEGGRRHRHPCEPGLALLREREGARDPGGRRGVDARRCGDVMCRRVAVVRVP